MAGHLQGWAARNQRLGEGEACCLRPCLGAHACSQLAAGQQGSPRAALRLVAHTLRLPLPSPGAEPLKMTLRGIESTHKHTYA